MKPSDKYGAFLFGSLEREATVEDWAAAYNTLRDVVEDLESRLDACEKGWAEDTA